MLRAFNLLPCLPVINDSELFSLRVRQCIALPEISLTNCPILVLALQPEPDGPVAALAVDAHNLHVLLFVPHVRVVPVEPKHDHLPPAVHAYLVYNVQVLLLLLRDLAQEVRLFADLPEEGALAAPALVHPVDVDVLVLGGGHELLALSVVEKGQHALVVVRLQLLVGLLLFRIGGVVEHEEVALGVACHQQVVGPQVGCADELRLDRD